MTCAHYAFKTPQQPCPHPDCWKHGYRLSLPRQTEPAAYADVDSFTGTVVDVYERSRIIIPDIGEVWAWRPLQ